MRYTSFYPLMMLLIISNCSCYGQKLVKKISDAPKLEQNKQLFINKPLSTLLNQIKPDVKSVYAEGNRSDGLPSFFIIKFVDTEDQKKFTLAKKLPLRITVFVKEKFTWDRSKKPINEREKWTSEDVEKYKNLTIIGIRVSGEVNP